MIEVTALQIIGFALAYALGVFLVQVGLNMTDTFDDDIQPAVAWLWPFSVIVGLICGVLFGVCFLGEVTGEKTTKWFADRRCAVDDHNWNGWDTYYVPDAMRAKGFTHQRLCRNCGRRAYKGKDVEGE